ncbi:MAG: cardiolipin synthase [Helicobacteraceae bacterium 4484_230]|nr:MAG: cardiolipin synthase [Helicobacteraceae bacterium 4484_230]
MAFWLAAAALFHLLGIFSAVHAVMHGRTSQGTIAWVMGLTMVPYVAVPMYWILGSSRFHGYITARYGKDEWVREKLDVILGPLKPHALTLPKRSKAAEAAQKLADLPFLGGNRVELLIDGEQMFSSLLNGIDAAEHYILFQFYIINDDLIGREVRSRLVARAKEGVLVHFLYDEIGSYSLGTDYLNDLRAAGVEVYPFHTRKGRGNRFQINFRNHRKVMVADGKSAWIGGMNIGDEYLGRNAKIGNWRDTHMKITGPAALAVQISFVEDWFWAADEIVPSLIWEPVPAKEDVPVLIVPSGPADPVETAALMFHHAINLAQKRLWIASPYFVPDDAIIAALRLAALRGVDVRILIPDRGDNRLVDWSAWSYCEQLHHAGIGFFRYTDGFLHEKVMLIDDEVASVGTANFDNRSFRLNFEITGIITDHTFASDVEKMFERDFVCARKMRDGDFTKRTFLSRLLSRLSRLLAPIQ